MRDQCGLGYDDVHATGNEHRFCVRAPQHDGECVIYNRRFGRWVACEPDPQGEEVDDFLWREITAAEAKAMIANEPVE